jgi:hypothetical protein
MQYFHLNWKAGRQLERDKISQLVKMLELGRYHLQDGEEHVHLHQTGTSQHTSPGHQVKFKVLNFQNLKGLEKHSCTPFILPRIKYLTSSTTH